MEGVLGDATVIAAAIAAVVAVGGYLMSQHEQRVDRKSRVYADALRSVRTYQELPYEIWRRDDDSHQTVARLRAAEGAAYQDVQYHLQLLRIESTSAGQAYEDLFEQTRRQHRVNRQKAWSEPMSSLRRPALRRRRPALQSPSFIGDNGAEIDLCLSVMRAELRPWRLVLRRGMLKKLDEQRERRQPSGTIAARKAAVPEA